MRNIFANFIGVLVSILMYALVVFPFYYFGLLYYLAMFLLGAGTLGLLVALVWLWDCKGQSGCFSGVILAAPVIMIPLGLVFLLTEYVLGLY